MHWEFDALVQVSGDVQCVTAGHALHTSAGPELSLQYPLAHCGHRELLAVVHVSGCAHCATSVHGTHCDWPATEVR